MKNIVLTGFMASGKTTVGKEIARLMDFDFKDTDLIIEKNLRMTVNDIFKLFGEKHFRILENEICKELADCKNSVISCGGGLVLNSENIKILKKNGIVFNLKTNPDIIKERLKSASMTRPLLNSRDFSDAIKRFEERKPFYDICDYQINIAGKSAKELAQEIIKIYKEA